MLHGATSQKDEPAAPSRPLETRSALQHFLHRQANTRIRTRPGSTTEKCPAQSSRAVIRSARRAPTSLGFGIGMRNNTTPHVAGSADARASSPKSLSKVAESARPLPPEPESPDGLCPALRLSASRHRGPQIGAWTRRRRGSSRWREGASHAALGNTPSELKVSRA